MPTLAKADYQSLAELRYQIRRFLHFSQQAALQVRMEPRQHQFLLALKGLPESVRPSVGALAERLQIRPHSAVELANRLAKRGLLQRHRDGVERNSKNTNKKTKTKPKTKTKTKTKKDRREVLLTVTEKGERVLRELSLHHRAELRTAGPALIAALQAVLKTGNRRRIPRSEPQSERVLRISGR
jgi:DNA-binding MarR family transcriptional regulator